MTNRDKLAKIIDAIHSCTGVTLVQMQDRKRKLSVCTARGVLYLLARKQGISCQETADFVARSRVSCLLVTQKYLDYLSVKDKTTIELYDKVCQILKMN